MKKLEEEREIIKQKLQNFATLLKDSGVSFYTHFLSILRNDFNP